ncbi:unnamed protein product [Schistosoma intercalatum]|nr:unnamed protein product [Schistosoma intercalatum]
MTYNPRLRLADSRNDQSKTIGEDRSEMTLSPHVTHLSGVCKRSLKGYLEENHLGVFDWESVKSHNQCYLKYSSKMNLLSSSQYNNIGMLPLVGLLFIVIPELVIYEFQK